MNTLGRSIGHAGTTSFDTAYKLIAPHLRLNLGEMDSQHNEAIYAGTYYMIRSLGWLATGMKVTGGHYIPKKGGGLVAANHRSGFDGVVLPVATTKACGRPLSMVAHEGTLVSKLPEKAGKLVLAWADCLEPIIIDRDNFTRLDLEEITGRLNQGRLVGILPEGGFANTEQRETDGRFSLGPLSPGVAVMARLTGAPTNPVAITGFDNPLGPKQFRDGHIAIGRALRPPTKKSEDKAFMNLLRYRMESLLEQSQAA